MAHPTRRTLTAAVVGACVGLGALAAGCGDSGDEITIDSTTTESSATTGSTTTTESTTTERTPTTLDDEAAIRELHTQFMTEVGVAEDTRSIDRSTYMAGYERIAVNPLLGRIHEALDRYEDLGQYLNDPGYDSNITEIRLDGMSATVTDCSRDNGTLFGPDGEVLVPPDDFYKLRQTQFVIVDGQWFISDFYTGGDVRCEPNP